MSPSQPQSQGRTLADDTPGSVPDTRAGYVTLVGAPNAGKSTLLNAIVGEKLSIVTPKAQTTWQRVTGIATKDGAQMIFLDTPGLLEARDLFQRSMRDAALEAVREADVVLVVLDAVHPPRRKRTDPIRDAVGGSPVPRIAAVNKVDAGSRENIDAWVRWSREELGADVHRVSALEGTGLDALEDAVREALPVGPFLYPAEDLASAPVRFFAAELIRETIFEQFREEIPYATFARVEAFRENQEPVYIQADVFVEKRSQKRILIGKGGSAIRDLGEAAREKIEALLGRSVYLDLWVKVLQGWRRERTHLKRLGFRIPKDRG